VAIAIACFFETVLMLAVGSVPFSKDAGSNDLLWFETVGFMAWLFKDLGWAALSFPLALVAAAVALVVEVYQVPLRRSRQCPAAVVVHHEALLMWLLGNVVWMMSEFSFDPLSKAGQRFPWNHGPLVGVGGDESSYRWGCNATRIIMACAMLHLLRLYSKCFSSLFDGSERRKDLAWGLVTQEVYCWSFAGPWILKDIFWSLGLLWPALSCGLIVAMLMFDCWRRYGDVVHIAELLWVTGNMIWVYGEHGLKDAYQWPRQAAATSLLLGVLIVVFQLRGLAANTAQPVDAFLLGGSPEDCKEVRPIALHIGNGYSSSSRV
jgi:hypothetical protein